MALELSGRNIVVTGGTGALGTAVVKQLLDAGALCHVPNNDTAELERFPHIGHDKVKIARGVDLTDENAVGGYYRSLPHLWASIHLAGGFAMAPIAEAGAQAFAAQMNINALTCYLCCRAAVGNMRAGAPAGGGRIVNVAARPALEPRHGAGMILYTAAKAAVAAIIQSLAEETSADGIWVNAVAPSILDTPANRAAMPDADHTSWPKVDDVAATIVFLASPDNRTARGGVIPVYGKV